MSIKSFRIPFFIILFIGTYQQLAASDITQEYISKYKEIAIAEMKRTGIPASIKMAQAILESNSGRSTLATKSNNHFGIKCGRSWTGREVYYEDDDYDEDGLLTKSCFRAFDDPAESFYEHSDFLANPYSKRYKPLFKLDIYDYEAWAKGLKKAGYATDPGYPKKLIKIIEKYRLYELDLGIIPVSDYRQELAQKTNNTNESDIENKNDNKTISGMPRKINKVGTHRVRKGETMREIAGRHGIDVRALYLRNRLPIGTQPKVGEELTLFSAIHFKKKPKRAIASTQPTTLWQMDIVIPQ